MTLRGRYDCLLADLDGTLYRGKGAIPGAADALERAALRVMYVTNNASRSPDAVAEHLRELGFTADATDVVTSAQAAAIVLADAVPPGGSVLVVGAQALEDEVRNVGLKPVRSAQPQPDAVVNGHSTETAWPILAEASFAIRAGATWIAANADRTLPVERGLAPGNGAIVAALVAATDRTPVVAGKPAAPIMADALRRSGARNALVVGDRLDTDIEGANTAALDSFFVLTGVSTVDDLLRAKPAQRPTYVAFDLDALNRPLAADGRWSAHFDGTDIVLRGTGDAASALAAVAPLAWANPGFGVVRPDGTYAADVLAQWESRQSSAPIGAATLPAPAAGIG